MLSDKVILSYTKKYFSILSKNNVMLYDTK